MDGLGEYYPAVSACRANLLCDYAVGHLNKMSNKGGEAGGCWIAVSERRGEEPRKANWLWQEAKQYNQKERMTPVTNSRNWAGIENLYGVVKQGSYLYVIDYDSANVVKIDIATYTVVPGGTYTFSSGGAPTYEDHGVALAAVDGYVYALFITSDSSASNYQNSTLVKLDVSGTAPTAVSTVAVGRNAQTLEYYDGKFYIACIGGMQHDGAANINIGQSRLDVVTISTMTRVTPFTTNGTTIPGDFRDIVLSASGDAYILTGYYDNGFTTFNGVLHYTTAASINSRSISTSLRQPAVRLHPSQLRHRLRWALPTILVSIGSLRFGSLHHLWPVRVLPVPLRHIQKRGSSQGRRTGIGRKEIVHLSILLKSRVNAGLH